MSAITGLTQPMYQGSRSPLRHVYIFALLGLAFVLPVSGCSSTAKEKAASGKAVSATDEQIFIGDTVEKNYDPNVIVKRAESFFEKEEYAEAVIEYQHFLDLHRIHVLAPYVEFRLGESYFKMNRSIDRDLDPVRKALEVYQKLLKDYPGSKWEGEAKQRIRECHEIQAQGSFFVGQFYLRREAYLAAAKRFDGIVKQFPELEIAGDALYELASAYHEIGADDWAQEKLFALEQKYPNHKHKTESQKLYAKLNLNNPANATVKGGAPQAPPPPPTLMASAAPVAAVSHTLAAGGNSQNGADTSHSSSGRAAFSEAVHQPALPLAGPTATGTPLTSAAAVSAGPSTMTASVSDLPPISTVNPQTTTCRLGMWC